MQIAVNVSNHSSLLLSIGSLRCRNGKSQGIRVPVTLKNDAFLVGRNSAFILEEAVESSFIGVEPVLKPAAEEVLGRPQTVLAIPIFKQASRQLLNDAELIVV
jgi:hypothetical protein